MIDFARRIVIPEDAVLREVESEAVLLNLATQRYYALNEVGAHMLQVLTGSLSIAQAYAILLAEYEVDSRVLRADLQKLVEDLHGQGLVTIV